MIALFFLFFFFIFGMSALAIWVYTLIEIIKDEYKNDTDKLIWFLLVFFLPFVGTILYFFIGKNKVSISREEYV